MHNTRFPSQGHHELVIDTEECEKVLQTFPECFTGVLRYLEGLTNHLAVQQRLSDYSVEKQGSVSQQN